MSGLGNRRDGNRTGEEWGLKRVESAGLLYACCSSRPLLVTQIQRSKTLEDGLLELRKAFREVRSEQGKAKKIKNKKIQRYFRGRRSACSSKVYEEPRYDITSLAYPTLIRILLYVYCTVVEHWRTHPVRDKGTVCVCSQGTHRHMDPAGNYHA